MNDISIDSKKIIPTENSKAQAKTMKAIISTKYGSSDVLQLQGVAITIIKEDQVLIKVHATIVSRADTMMRTGYPLFGRLFMGLFKPKNPIPGTGVAGKIEAIGKNVSQFKVGDEVFGETILSFGANAEYVAMKETEVLAQKPSNISYEEAAPICDGALTSINFLKNIAKLQAGQRILINGASGSLGTAAVQLAKHYGAHVTGVCSTTNVELVKSLGADKVIDYKKEDFTKAGLTYDVIYDTVGLSSFSKCKKSLTKNGAYISPVLGMPLLFQMLWTSMFGSKKAKFSATGILPIPELRILLNELVDIIKAGKLKTIIDKRYPLEQVALAHSYVDKGHKKGNIVIDLKM